jgi:hypothetical protein
VDARRRAAGGWGHAAIRDRLRPARAPLREAVAEERERDPRADERGRPARTLEAWGEALALMAAAAALAVGAFLLPSSL